MTEITDILEVSVISLLRGLPDEKEIRIIDDMYHDIYLDITQEEHEMLWNLNLFKGDLITLKNYRRILSMVRATMK